MISHPLDFPEVSTRTITIEKNYATEVRVKPLKIISLPAVKTVSLKYRLCKFSNDIISKVSSLYSFQTCMVECKINAIYNLCKCIPYFYPNPGQNIYNMYMYIFFNFSIA